MFYGQQSRKRKRPTNGVFDPNDENKVKHTKVGVWNLYQEVPPPFRVASLIPASFTTWLEPHLEVLKSLPYVKRMFLDIGRIQYCLPLLVLLLLLDFVLSLMPALQLWYSGQFLKIVETALNTRTVDDRFLLRITTYQFACTVAAYLLGFAKTSLSTKLNLRIRLHYSTHSYYAIARLDVPTFSDDAVHQQLQSSVSMDSNSSVAWRMITGTMHIFGTIVKLVSQLSVLVAILKEQDDGLLLASLSFLKPLWSWFTRDRQSVHRGMGVWAATTVNEDYIRSQGLKKAISDTAHRQEIVAGNMWKYMLESYRDCMHRLGDDAMGFFEAKEHMQRRFRFSHILQNPINELPRIVFTLRAVHNPTSIPLSLASFNLITSTASSFSNTVLHMLDSTSSIADNFESVRRLYEVLNIPNKVVDGAKKFPEDARKIADGIEIEFRNVSFSYGDKRLYALHDVSFKILPGQLCVIIGPNGSGKSTILKLIARIYDPDEGQILIDGHDIQKLNLDDLRATISVLFQDYTHFPLSIHDNISLGCPPHAHDRSKVEQAARLGGADSFLSSLPDGLDTYLDRPVNDIYAGIPEGTKTLFGRNVNYKGIRGAGRMTTSAKSSLSGGQMQRIALSRTFMRSLDQERPMGLLLFDEPSASLDPIAEHDLFERLRNLRGSKTMIFSSHRFGNLTRHADLILYINNSAVIEEGTHAELMAKKDSKYAEIWSIQARAFLP